jgi:hypothetical protein
MRYTTFTKYFFATKGRLVSILDFVEERKQIHHDWTFAVSLGLGYDGWHIRIRNDDPATTWRNLVMLIGG